MASVIPFPPPLAPRGARIDARRLFLDVDYTAGEVVLQLAFRHPEQQLRMRLHWRVGDKSVVEYPPTEHVAEELLDVYNALVDRLVSFAYFLESHDGTSANDVRLVLDAFFPTVSMGAPS